MGSQQYYQMQQQAAPGLMGAPALPQASVGMPSGYPVSPQGLPGIDPALQAQIAQSLQNPNGGDGFSAQGGAAPGAVPSPASFLPGSPTDLLIGAGVGTGIGLGLSAINGKWNGTEKLAKFVDNLPGVRQLSGHLESRLAKVQKPGMREWLLRDAVDKGAPAAIANAEKRQLSMMSKGYAAKFPEVQKLLAGGTTFDGAKSALTQKIAALEAKGKSLSKAEYKSLKAYRGAFQSIHGMKTFSYSAVHAQQAAQMAHLTAKGVGPIGRSVAHLSMYTERIFNGGTLKNMLGGKADEAGAKAFSLGRLLPAALGGAFIIGGAVSKARKAKEGEKTSTFMHEFWGIGIGSLVGWEVGQKFLTAIGFRGLMDKVGSKLGASHLANRVMTPGRGLLEKVFSPASVSKVAKFLPKFTFGGVTVGLLGMFAFGSIFQKIFEKASDSIFGKPSPESLNPDAQQPASTGTTGADMSSMGGLTGANAFAGFQQSAAPAQAMPSMANTASGFSQTPADATFSNAIQSIRQSQQQLGY